MIWLVQLVFDCADPDAVMRFWGQVLDYRNPVVDMSHADLAAFRAAHPQFDGRGRIDDNDLRRPPVYIQRVPEPKTGRNRVRLEIGTSDVAEIRARGIRLGATQLPDGTFADVEGNEFTIVPTDADDVRPRSIVIDARDPERLLAFWSAATGYPADDARARCDPPSLGLSWAGDRFMLSNGDDHLLHICGAGASPGPAPFDLTPGLQFEPTDELKAGKNRIHLDLNSTDADTERTRLERLGATVLQWDADHVLADPEGNEFCLSGRP